jgi:acetyl-CoA acyltransferase
MIENTSFLPFVLTAFYSLCRIPFAMSGTVYNDYMAVDLARFALKGLLVKTALDPKLIDYVLLGTVIQEAKTSNIAREAAMGAGIPINVPASTVTQACISANLAITTAAEKILSGQADIIVAGGTETASDVPIRYTRAIRKRLMQVPKLAKQGAPALLKLLKGLKLADLAPEAPSISNFTTGEVMVSEMCAISRDVICVC